jgi:predicted RND superfamily exporter protein
VLSDTDRDSGQTLIRRLACWTVKSPNAGPFSGTFVAEQGLMMDFPVLYSKTILGRPFLILALLLGVLIFFSANVSHFRLDASADSLLLEGDEDLRVFRQMSERYQTRSFIFVAFIPNQDLFAQSTLNVISQIKNEITALDGVESVVTLLDVPLLKQHKGSLSEIASGYRTLESPLVDTDKARDELIVSPIFSDLLISADGKTTALQVNLAENTQLIALQAERDQLLLRSQQANVTVSTKQSLDRVEQAYALAKDHADQHNHQLIGQLRGVMDQHRDHGQLVLGGVPMVADDMITFIRNDLLVFGCGVFLFLVLILSLIFRQPRWVLLPLISCAYAGLTMVGLLGFMDWPVTVISSNFVALMLIITMSMTVHLIVRYRQLERDEPGWSQQELVFQTTRKMFWPCLYTALTTIIAFGSLVFSDIKPVIDFGWMMSLGLGVTFLTCFLLFPVMLVLLGHASRAQIRTARPFHLTLGLARLTEHHGRWILVLAVVLIGLSFIGMMRLEVENSFVNYFGKDTEIHRGLRVIDEQLGGTTPLDILIRFPEAESSLALDEEDEELKLLLGTTDTGTDQDYWFTPDKIELVKKAHDYIGTVYGIGKVMSVASLVRVGEQINKGPFDAFELAIVYKRMPQDLKSTLVDPFISVADNEARISVRVKDSLADLRRDELLKQLRVGLVQDVGLAEDRLQITGLLVLYNNMLQSLFKSQIEALGVVMLGIAIMLLILFRSWALAIIGIIPNLLAAVSILGLMGLIGIPLDMMTITIASITIGVAVDNSIHYLYRFREEFRHHRDYMITLRNCHASIGNAISYTAITIIAGFSILTLSNFVPTIHFGMLTALAMLIALLASLTLMPKLLLIFKPL